MLGASRQAGRYIDDGTLELFTYSRRTTPVESKKVDKPGNKGDGLENIKVLRA